LLARYLGIGKDPAALCQIICKGNTVRFDAGSANGRVFLLMAGCGFDAEVVRRVHARRTGHVSNLTYCRPILAAISNYSFPEIQVHWEHRDCGDVQTPWSVRWLFAFNLPCYAGLSMASQADGTDGLLDVWGLRRGGLISGLGYLAAILARLHHRLPSYAARRVRRLRLTSEAEVPYQLDGDPGGILPLDLDILPGRLTLVIP
jgi:diacylglycerol kinase family enzyme